MKNILSPIKNNDGFSLLELIITMTLVVIVLTMNTDTFSMIMRQSRQQAQVANAGMNRIIGFEVLRTGVEMAGYGLPWTLPAGTNYAEATAASGYNDSPSGAPHAIMSGDNTGFNGSDYLVLKGSAVGKSDTAQKWSFVINDGTAAAPKAKLWTIPSDLTTGERVIAIWANTTGTFDKQLVLNGASIFGTVADTAGTLPAGLKPWTQSEWFLVYAIDPNTDLRMPFNRADYYVARPANMPQGCAPNTGILYKAPVSHADGSLANPIPLLDCVADMQVAFVLDTNGDGVVDYTFTTDNPPTSDISGLTAKQVRDQVKEVRIYVLSHEGTADPGFTYLNNTIRVGENPNPNTGRDFDLAATIGAGWQRYRWKVDTLVMAPKNILK
jgi:prepilin-type N-terminal cleavage/methylation domain-containing protein